MTRTVAGSILCLIALARHSGIGQGIAQAGVDPADASGALLEALAYSPDVGLAIVQGSARAVGASLEALPELGGVVVEAAGSVFEALLSIVAAVLEGLAG